MPEIKMKIGERKQEAEIKLLEALENHGWRKLDVLEAIDADYREEDKYELVYINSENKPEKIDLANVSELLDKMEQENGFLSVTDKGTMETHMIAVKKVNDLYIVADAPAGENMMGKIQDAMVNEANAELGFLDSIIEALKEFIDNVINGLEVLRNRVPEDAYTRYKEPNNSFKQGLRGMEEDEALMTARFNAAMNKVFKDGGKFKDNPFAGGMVLDALDNNTTFEMAANFFFKHAENDMFRLDLNSPEASTILNVLDEAYVKAHEKRFDCVEKYQHDDFVFIETIRGMREMHEIKAEAEVARGDLANVTGKAYANMDEKQKAKFEKDIVKIVKAELATEFLSVLPATGKDLKERYQSIQGMQATLNSLEGCQPLKDAIQDSMKSTLKETLKSLSEKIKNKDFQKAIQKDVEMKKDATKKEEKTITKENVISNSKDKAMGK